MILKEHTDALVVGAGPVGLFSALLLSRRGIAVQIIDEEWRPGAHSYALALHPHSLKLLEEAGLTSALLEVGRPVPAVNFYAGKERAARLDYRQLSTGYPFILTVPQNTLEELLERQLKAAGRHVHWEHRLAQLRLQEDSVFATVDQLGKESTGYAVHLTEWVTEATRWIDASFVVGADGHRSAVRRALGMELAAVGSPRFYALFEFQCPAEVSEAAVVLDEGKRSVLWPLPGGRVRWSFEIQDADIPAESRLKSRLPLHVGSQIYPYLAREDLHRLLAERAPWFEGEVGQITWSLGVRFDQRLARGFGAGRVWLAGDAAHLADPMGVQSLNQGLAEGADLARRISGVLQDHVPLETLAGYHEHRMRVWRQLFGQEDLPATDGGTTPWVASHAAELPAAIAASGEELTALLEQLHLHLPPVMPAGSVSGVV